MSAAAWDCARHSTMAREFGGRIRRKLRQRRLRPAADAHPPSPLPAWVATFCSREVGSTHRKGEWDRAGCFFYDHSTAERPKGNAPQSSIRAIDRTSPHFQLECSWLIIRVTALSFFRRCVGCRRISATERSTLGNDESLSGNPREQLIATCYSLVDLRRVERHPHSPLPVLKVHRERHVERAVIVVDVVLVVAGVRPTK